MSARVRYLTVAEAQRLLNACPPDFRNLAQAALQTGCRYGELGRLTVRDFNPDSGTVAILRSKTGRSRHVVLTEEGVAFFSQLCAGRGGGELMLRRANGEPWGAANQIALMAEASRRAALVPPVNFHGLRHTYASLSIMNGAPLVVVAANLGHANTKMVEKHYGHLARSFVRDAIRAAAPRFGMVEPTTFCRFAAGKSAPTNDQAQSAADSCPRSPAKLAAGGRRAHFGSAAADTGAARSFPHHAGRDLPPLRRAFTDYGSHREV